MPRSCSSAAMPKCVHVRCCSARANSASAMLSTDTLIAWIALYGSLALSRSSGMIIALLPFIATDSERTTASASTIGTTSVRLPPARRSTSRRLHSRRAEGVGRMPSMPRAGDAACGIAELAIPFLELAHDDDAEADAAGARHRARRRLRRHRVRRLCTTRASTSAMKRGRTPRASPRRRTPCAARRLGELRAPTASRCSSCKRRRGRRSRRRRGRRRAAARFSFCSSASRSYEASARCVHVGCSRGYRSIVDRLCASDVRNLKAGFIAHRAAVQHRLDLGVVVARRRAGSPSARAGSLPPRRASAPSAATHHRRLRRELRGELEAALAARARRHEAISSTTGCRTGCEHAARPSAPSIVIERTVAQPRARAPAPRSSRHPNSAPTFSAIRFTMLVLIAQARGDPLVARLWILEQQRVGLAPDPRVLVGGVRQGGEALGGPGMRLSSPRSVRRCAAPTAPSARGR